MDKEKLIRTAVDFISLRKDMELGHRADGAVEWVNECGELIDERRFVDAIKHCRESTGAGLKEAKELMDELRVLREAARVSKREEAKDYVSAIDKLRGNTWLPTP